MCASLLWITSPDPAHLDPIGAVSPPSVPCLSTPVYGLDTLSTRPALSQRAPVHAWVPDTLPFWVPITIPGPTYVPCSPDLTVPPPMLSVAVPPPLLRTMRVQPLSSELVLPLALP